jgi:FkbM family methyltransferase
MYRDNKGLKEWSLDRDAFISEFVIKCERFGENPNNVRFHSQQDEDKFIIQYILNDRIQDGTFLEIGAYDGVLHSNTKTLEDHFGFKGILIEPQRKFFKQLKQNRPNCECYNFAVTNSDEPFIDFIGEGFESGTTESILDPTYRVGSNLIEKHQWSRTSYPVPNKKMKDILAESQFDYIDIMSIDVEGSELDLLKSIDFTFPIFCILIEAHSDAQDRNKIVGNHLKSNGFTYYERQRGNEVWINKNYFRKHLFNTNFGEMKTT